MQLSYNGIKLLKELEGFRDEAYQDSAGVWTIGFGTTRIDDKPVEPGMKCSEQEAEQWLAHDVAWASTAVNQLVKQPLRQNMYDALVCFVYNIGRTAFEGSSLLRYLNQGRLVLASEEFTKWVYAGGKVNKGLLNRRIKEQKLFRS